LRRNEWKHGANEEVGCGEVDAEVQTSKPSEIQKETKNFELGVKRFWRILKPLFSCTPQQDP